MKGYPRNIISYPAIFSHKTLYIYSHLPKRRSAGFRGLTADGQGISRTACQLPAMAGLQCGAGYPFSGCMR